MDASWLPEAITTVIVIVAGCFLLPYLKSRLEGGKLDELMRWADIAVQAAELLFAGRGMGASKKGFVRELLGTHSARLDDLHMEAVIEAAVLRLKAAETERDKR